MEIDGNGKVTEYDVFPSVIRSCHRLTYTAVQEVLDGKKETCERYRDVASHLSTMKELAEE